MSKSLYILCAVNMAASAVALFLIFRPPTKTRLKIPAPAPQATASALAPEAIWRAFAQAPDRQTATALIDRLPASDTSLEQAATYLRDDSPAVRPDGAFIQMGRKAACLQFLATHAGWDSPYRLLLQSLAKDRQAPVILRDLALRGVIDMAARRQAAQEPKDETRRAEVSDFLLQNDFGTKTSMEGLALQAAGFVQDKAIAPIDRHMLTERLRGVLRDHATVQESTLVAALEVCGLTLETDLADAIRPIVQAPRSEAVQQAAIAALGQIGTEDDRAWLARQRFPSAALYRTAETAWLDSCAPARAAGGAGGSPASPKADRHEAVK